MLTKHFAMSHKDQNSRLTYNLFVKRWINFIEILFIQAVGEIAQALTEALIVNYLTLTEEFDDIANVGVVGTVAKNIVVGCSCLLFGCH